MEQLYNQISRINTSVFPTRRLTEKQFDKYFKNKPMILKQDQPIVSDHIMSIFHSQNQISQFSDQHQNEFNQSKIFKANQHRFLRVDFQQLTKNVIQQGFFNALDIQLNTNYNTFSLSQNLNEVLTFRKSAEIYGKYLILSQQKSLMQYNDIANRMKRIVRQVYTIDVPANQQMLKRYQDYTNYYTTFLATIFSRIRAVQQLKLLEEIQKIQQMKDIQFQQLIEEQPILLKFHIFNTRLEEIKRVQRQQLDEEENQRRNFALQKFEIEIHNYVIDKQETCSDFTKEFHVKQLKFAEIDKIVQQLLSQMKINYDQHFDINIEYQELLSGDYKQLDLDFLPVSNYYYQLCRLQDFLIKTELAWYDILQLFRQLEPSNSLSDNYRFIDNFEPKGLTEAEKRNISNNFQKKIIKLLRKCDALQPPSVEDISSQIKILPDNFPPHILIGQQKFGKNLYYHVIYEEKHYHISSDMLCVYLYLNSLEFFKKNKLIFLKLQNFNFVMQVVGLARQQASEAQSNPKSDALSLVNLNFMSALSKQFEIPLELFSEFSMPVCEKLIQEHIFSNFETFVSEMLTEAFKNFVDCTDFNSANIMDQLNQLNSQQLGFFVGPFIHINNTGFTIIKYFLDFLNGLFIFDEERLKHIYIRIYKEQATVFLETKVRRIGILKSTHSNISTNRKVVLEFIQDRFSDWIRDGGYDVKCKGQFCERIKV